MKHPFAILLPALAAAAAIFGSGCIAIPMGAETFTTERPAEIRATSDTPVVTCRDCEVKTSETDETHLSVSFSMLGTIESEQAREQRFQTIIVEKQKHLAFGLFPGYAEVFCRPSGSLQPMFGWNYEGNGKYLIVTSGNDTPVNEVPAPYLGFLVIPYSLLYVPLFGEYGCDSHHWYEGHGSFEKSNLLGLFPEKEREAIEAWTWKDADKHKQRADWSSISHSGWIGFHKYCSFVVREGEPCDRTTSAEPEKKVFRRSLSGPYSATLTLPDCGYAETVEVESGMDAALFRLVDAANGEPSAKGTIRFLPPSGGLAAVQNDENRALFERAMERDWPVTVALPAPRLGMAPSESGVSGPSRPRDEPYQISSIEPKDGTLTVRVTVTDTSKTFEIDRKVQPEVRRMFREQFATGGNATRREALRMDLLDGGKALVYTVTFE